MTRVVFALERDAKTDPPEPARECETDQGIGVWYAAHGRWYRTDGFTVINPQPSWWYDLRHTDGEGVTVEDLRCLTEPPDAFSPTIGQRRYWQAAARLRRALAAVSAEKDS